MSGESCVGVESGWCPNGEAWGEPLAIHIDGAHHESIEEAFHTGVLGFCGCGQPERVARLVGGFLALLRRQWSEMRADTSPLLALTPEKEAMYRRHREDRSVFFGGHEGLDYMVAYVADLRGLTEHGGSIGGEWLTDGGELWLDLLEAASRFEKESNQP